MQKRAFIVHGWGGNPGSDWYPWLRKELESRTWDVQVPEMPDTEHPRIEPWVAALKRAVGSVDRSVYFIGHSIGCQAILRYLSKEPEAGGAVFVAGWFHLKGLGEEEIAVAKPWLETPLDLGSLRLKSVCIYSEDDPYVPASDVREFEKRLGSKVKPAGKKGHFTAEDGVTELPLVLEAIQELHSDE